MRMRAWLPYGLGLVLLGTVGAAPTDDPEIVLTIELQEEISVKSEDGRILVVRREAGRTEPGNVLLYTLKYTNQGDSPALNARILDVVPAGTVLLPGSVRGEKASVSFSVDGGKTYASYPVEVEVPGPDGKPVRRRASAEQYTHIRWTAMEPLKPGESRVATFKVLVE